MKRIWIILLLLSLPISAATVSGYIVDAQTGESIIGVNVFIRSTGIGDATDLDGFFVLRNVMPGEYSLTISHIAYQDSSRSITVGRANLFLGNLPLAPAPITTQAVEVTGVKNTIIQKDADIASFQDNQEVCPV